MIKKKFPHKRTWQAVLLSRKVRRDAIPIQITAFKRIKGNIGLHGYRRVRSEDVEGVRMYRKDSHGTVLVYINLEESTIEAKTQTWGGLMSLCGDFSLISYRRD
ncbi:MAG: hypothetical protein ACYS4W_14770 [Planctomycetota bacterium]|jgi:hypothetical protein